MLKGDVKTIINLILAELKLRNTNCFFCSWLVAHLTVDGLIIEDGLTDA